MSSLALGDPQQLLPTGAPKAEQRVKAIDANPQGSSGSGNEQRTQGNQADPDGEGLFSVGSSGTMKSEGSNGGGNSMKNDSDVHSKNRTIGDGVFLTGAPPSPTERHPPANESKSPRSNIPRLPQRWGKASDADSQVLLGPRYGPQKPKESRGKKVPSNIRSRFGFVNKQRKLVSPKPTPSPAAAAASSRKVDSIGAVNKGPRQPRVKPLSMSPDDPRRQKRGGVDIWAVRSRALGEEGAVVGGSARAVREKRFKMPPSSTKSLGTLSSRAPVQRRRAADVPSYLRPTASTKLKAIAAFEQRKAVQEKEAALQLPPPGSGSPGNSPRAASLSPRVTSKRFTRAESPRHQRASQPSPDHSPVQFEKHSRTRQDDTDSVGSRGSRRSHHSHRSHRSRRSHSRKHRHHHRHHDGHHHHHHRHSHSHSPRVPSSALSRPHDVERMEHHHYEHRITDAGVGGRYGIDHVAVEKSKGHVRSTSEPDSRFTAFAFTEDISDDDLLQEVDRYLATTTKDQLDTRSPSDHHDDAAQQPAHHSKHVKFQDPPVSHRVRVSPVRVKPEPPPKQQRLQQPPPSSERPRPLKLTERQKAQQRRDLLARRAKARGLRAAALSAKVAETEHRAARARDIRRRLLGYHWLNQDEIEELQTELEYLTGQRMLLPETNHTTPIEVPLATAGVVAASEADEETVESLDNPHNADASHGWRSENADSLRKDSSKASSKTAEVDSLDGNDASPTRSKDPATGSREESNESLAASRSEAARRTPSVAETINKGLSSGGSWSSSVPALDEEQELAEVEAALTRSSSRDGRDRERRRSRRKHRRKHRRHRRQSEGDDNAGSMVLVGPGGYEVVVEVSERGTTKRVIPPHRNRLLRKHSTVVEEDNEETSTEIDKAKQLHTIASSANEMKGKSVDGSSSSEEEEDDQLPPWRRNPPSKHDFHGSFYTHHDDATYDDDEGVEEEKHLRIDLLRAEKRAEEREAQEVDDVEL